MSYELLQSHLQSTLNTLNNPKIGKKNQNSKKNGSSNTTNKTTVYKSTNTAKKSHKKKFSQLGNELSTINEIFFSDL